MTEHFTVQMDSKGYVLIPAPLRKSLKISPKSFFIVSEEGGEIRLIPGEVRARREMREYTREEIAQSLIDGAVTPEGIDAAKSSIRDLGLDPDTFHPNL
jgi:bifunctional DNA-binding transcriptional regulator/antitoxin component of YhaV-PrlF toxin-antitoxin module